MELIVYLSYNVAIGINNDAVFIWEVTFDLKVAASGCSLNGDPYGTVPQ